MYTYLYMYIYVNMYMYRCKWPHIPDSEIQRAPQSRSRAGKHYRMHNWHYKLLCLERSPPGHSQLLHEDRAIITLLKCTFSLEMCISEFNAYSQHRFEMHIQAGNVHFKI